MANQTASFGDTNINGTLTVKTLALPPGAVTDTGVAASANVNATKLMHRHRSVWSQSTSSLLVAERKAVYWAWTTGTIGRVYVGLTVACVGGATLTVDVLKNGTSVLSAPITLTSGTAAYGSTAAVVTSPNLILGDVLEVNATGAVGGGTLGQGLFCVVDVDENCI